MTPTGAPGLRALRPGDRVAVVAPSGPVDPAALDAGVAWLTGLGLDVRVGAHVLDRAGFLAGDDAARAADLQDAWCDPGVAAVLCARGGYGATRVLDHLDWTMMATAVRGGEDVGGDAAAGRGDAGRCAGGAGRGDVDGRAGVGGAGGGAGRDAWRGAGVKVLHGSSDITALHVAFGARLGVATSFGPMVASLLADPDPVTAAATRAVLFGAPAAVTGGHPLVPGRARGRLTGGNLSLLTSLLGTAYAPPPARGRVVLLEDVGEAPYRVDRMLTQLLMSGWLDGAAGIALGGWTNCGDPGRLAAVLAERLGGLGVPVAAGLPIGHGAPQHTVTLGVPVALDADSGTLTPADPGDRSEGEPCR